MNKSHEQVVFIELTREADNITIINKIQCRIINFLFKPWLRVKYEYKNLTKMS